MKDIALLARRRPRKFKGLSRSSVISEYAGHLTDQPLSTPGRRYIMLKAAHNIVWKWVERFALDTKIGEVYVGIVGWGEWRKS